MKKTLCVLLYVAAFARGDAGYVRIESCPGEASLNAIARSMTVIETSDKTDSASAGHTYSLGDANTNFLVNRYLTIQEGQIIPSAPVLVRPSWAAHDTSLTSSDTLIWNAAVTGTGTTSYEVQVAADLAFSSVVRTVSGITDTTTVVRLGLSTKYYWRVMAFDGQLPGSWSAIDSFRTLYMSPVGTPPNKLLPVGNSKTVSSKPTLVIYSVPAALMYHFQVWSGAASGFYSPGVFVLDDSTYDTTYAFTSSLTPSTTYYWRVRGFNPAGSTLFSAVDSFTVMFLPATPVKAYPAPNQADVPVNPLTLKWYHEAGDSNYVVKLWTYTSGGPILKIDTTRNDTSWTIVSGLLNRAYYYWKVQCFNQGGASAYSAVDSFTSVIERPNSPTGPLYPKGNGPWPRVPVFRWGGDVNALWYHLQVATTSDFLEGIVVDTSMIPDTTVKIADTLSVYTTYYWRVSAINRGGEGLFSAIAYFVISPDMVNRIGNEVPKEFALFQNYPNPFNPTTTVRYDLPQTSFVKIVLYDVLGRRVAELVDRRQAAGYYEVTFNAQNLSSGVYFCRISAGTFTAVKKLLLLK